MGRGCSCDVNTFRRWALEVGVVACPSLTSNARFLAMPMLDTELWWRSAQVELGEVQIKVKAANAAVVDSKQYLEKLPDYLKDVEKALLPLKKCVSYPRRKGRPQLLARRLLVSPWAA